MGHQERQIYFFLSQSIQTRNIPFFASSSYTMNFSNVSRNRFLANAGFSQPQPMSTGTTICGVIFDGGLVLGADTRATAGALISLIVFLSPFHIHSFFELFLLTLCCHASSLLLLSPVPFFFFQVPLWRTRIVKRFTTLVRLHYFLFFCFVF